jgi:carbamoyltransferase
MYILGVSCYFHDSAAALLKDGYLVAAAQEERFSRIKHDASFPRNAIRFCLDYARVSGHDLEFVVFYEKPFRKLDRILLTSLQTYPRSRQFFTRSTMSWIDSKLWIRKSLCDELGIEPRKVLFSDHHLSHAASAFLCSPFRESLIFTVDGVGEWTTTSFSIGVENRIRLLWELPFPHSLGLFFSTFTAFLGFEVNEGEYKVMALAAYGSPKYVDRVEKLIHSNADGSFALNMDYFSFHYSENACFNRRFLALFGEPRRPGQSFGAPEERASRTQDDVVNQRPLLSTTEQYYADLAASVQTITEEVLLNAVRSLRRETGQSRLCIAGGVALNGVANRRLLREGNFEELYIQPAAGDSGGALGAALWAHHCLLGHPRGFVMTHGSWGQSYHRGVVERVLEANHVSYRRFRSTESLLDEVVRLLCAGKVVGWFQGRFEWGPRALGHRSVLADARNPKMRDIVNSRIKNRELFRPFAPSVLADRAEQYFDLPNAKAHYPARFMLYVLPVKENQQRRVPAITHVDGSSRPQLVFSDTAEPFHSLLQRFENATGVPLLLNTSFNVRGQPIVNSPEDALHMFQNTDMDALVLEDCLVQKESSS